MAKRSVNTNVTRPSFVADPHSLMRSNGGRQIDWDLVAERARVGAFQVVVGAGGANPAATSVPVVALEGPVPSGTVLNFGEANFTVTVSASALAAATSIAVTALPGILQAGTLLDFGSNKFARVATDAAAGATSVAVDAIPTALAGGETATASGQKYAQTTADAVEGATSLTVEALKVGLDPADEATVLGADAEAGLDKFLPAGTVMVEIAATGKVVPRSMRPGSESAKYIMETNANENSKSDSLSGYGMLLGGVVLENLLPDADPSTGLIPSGYKTELQASGTGWAFEVYEDSRGD